MAHVCFPRTIFFASLSSYTRLIARRLTIVCSLYSATEHHVVSELGVFGVMLTDGDSIVTNSAPGVLLRTKPQGFRDGGVAAGVAVLDSPLLC